MKKVIALFILAIAIVALVPPAELSSKAALARAEQLEQVKFFKSLYPGAHHTIESKPCLKKYFEEYIKDTSVPLVNREPNIVCFDKKKDWLISYSATGIQNTPGLSVGIDSKTGEVIDFAFTSPYDDVYVINSSAFTTMGAVESAFRASNIKVRNGWGYFRLNDTSYTFYTITRPNLIILLYIEQTDGYRLPNITNLKQDIFAAHKKFELGAQRINEIIHNTFNANSSSYYLYFPSFQA